jgi:hypothetical protein
MAIATVARTGTFVCGGVLLLHSLLRGYGSAALFCDFLHGAALWGLFGFGITWLVLHEKERAGGDLPAGERARLWGVGAVICFTGMGWSWAGGAPPFVSPTLCFVGLFVCAIGALVSARGARHAARKDRASARVAAGVAVALLLVPFLLVGAFILVLVTSDGPFFG